MKLRTTHNSIRIRVRKSELVQLHETGQVEESIRFTTDVIFKFAITIDENINSVRASLVDNHLKISIPTTEADTWITTNEVGIEKNIQLDNEETLHILIEKDFPCLDRPEEDKSDTFWELAPDNPDAC